jgi:uridine kinase
MIVQHIKRTLHEKSKEHQEALQRLGKQVEDEPLSAKVLPLKKTTQVQAMSTVLENPMTVEIDFIFYFDRLAALLVERYVSYAIRQTEASIDSA